MELDKTVRYRPYTPLEDCLSGWKGRFAKSLYELNCIIGSNPISSAELDLDISNIIRIFDRFFEIMDNNALFE